MLLLQISLRGFRGWTRRVAHGKDPSTKFRSSCPYQKHKPERFSISYKQCTTTGWVTFDRYMIRLDNIISNPLFPSPYLDKLANAISLLTEAPESEPKAHIRPDQTL